MNENIPLLGMGLHLEDLSIGRRFRTVGRTLTEADLVAFINATGMTEVLFTDQEYLCHHSAIKGRVVPGAMVYCLAEGLLMQCSMQHTGMAFLGMDLDVRGPTLVGDTIHVVCEVVESRRSKSRPDCGLARTRNEVYKQDGQLVMLYTPLRMIKAKHPA